MKREEAIKEMREKLPWLTEDTKRLVEALIPELAESEDEWMLQTIIRGFENWKSNGKETFNFANVDDILAYLEKQKEHHLELKAGKWYICHRAFCARADHLTVKEGERFQCEKDGIVKGFVIKEPEKYFKECSTPEPMEKEQKPEEKPINWTELTWKDINELEGIINNVHYEFRNGIGQESFGKEVLEKFREYKGG